MNQIYLEYLWITSTWKLADDHLLCIHIIDIIILGMISTMRHQHIHESYPRIKNHVNSLYPTKAPTHVAVRLPGPLWIPASRAAMQWWAKRAPENVWNSPRKKKHKHLVKKICQICWWKKFCQIHWKVGEKKREKKKTKHQDGIGQGTISFQLQHPLCRQRCHSPALPIEAVGFSCEKYTDSIQIKWIQYKSHIIS